MFEEKAKGMKVADFIVEANPLKINKPSALALRRN